MSITIKNERIGVAGGALIALSQRPLTPKASYWMAKAIRKINNAIQDLNVARNKLIEQFQPELDDQGNRKTIKEDGIDNYVFGERTEAYRAAHKELMDIEVDIDLKQFNVEDLGPHPIPPNIFVALDWLFAEPADEPKGE